MKKFLHSLGNVFLTFVLFLLVVYGWAFLEVKILLKSYPELFGLIFYQQSTNEMSPQFEDNDIVVIKKGSSYGDGDIIYYFDSDESVYKVRYVVTKEDYQTTIKSSTSDELVTINNENIKGKALGKVQFMGAIVNFLKNKVFLIILAVIGVGCLVVSQYMEYKPNKDLPIEK